MFKNYIKVVLRNIFKHKGYSAINIVGLAVGIACCILILLWVRDELSYDGFHRKGDNIYRVLQDIHLDRDVTWAISQGPLGPALKADIPGISDYTRCSGQRFRIKYKNHVFDEVVELADPGFFAMFDFPLLKGEAETALNNPRSIVISEEMAVKYFGSEDPMGKVLNGNDQYDFVVSGVLAKVPRNSQLRPDFIIPFVFGRELQYTVDNWGNSQFTTFVLLKQDASAAEVEKQIAHYLDDKPTLEKGTILRLQPLTRIHLYSNFEFDRFGKGDIRYTRIFSIAAFFVLLIACINFMNLATARSATRGKEVGLRKVVGANRTGLMGQFFAESLFFAFLALVIAILLVELLLPVFNHLSGKEITFNLFANPLILTWILGITFFTGLVSGSYPALLLSSFRPVQILKGKFEHGNTGSLSRKILVVIQFSLSLIMIIGTLVVYKQLGYMREKKLGYDKDNLVITGMRGDFLKHYDVIKAELLRDPKILGVTRIAAIPTYGNMFSNSKWRWKGQNPGEEVLMHGNFVDFDYFETFGMEIKEGRSFSKGGWHPQPIKDGALGLVKPSGLKQKFVFFAHFWNVLVKEFPTDSAGVVLNEEAVRRMGVSSPVGMELLNADGKYNIVGVVKDYHFRSLHKAIEPLVLIFAPDSCRVLCVRTKSGDIPSTIALLEKTWQQYAADYPFDYQFLDERLENLYRVEQRVGTLFKYFTLLTIFISCLGLFGLSSFLAERRTKEIGIRKALGASISRIAFMLSKEFTRLVLLANVIAWPLAYFVMKKWLQNYAYHTEFGYEIFIVSGVLGLVIAWLTIAYQSIKAALTNPVDTLKYE